MPISSRLMPVATIKLGKFLVEGCQRGCRPPSGCQAIPRTPRMARSKLLGIVDVRRRG